MNSGFLSLKAVIYLNPISVSNSDARSIPYAISLTLCASLPNVIISPPHSLYNLSISFEGLKFFSLLLNPPEFISIPLPFRQDF